MARKDTFFLRTKLQWGEDTDYESDNIDISAYTDPARGKILVVDRSWVSFSSDSAGPIAANDIGTQKTVSVGIQACSEVQTGLVSLDNNSLFVTSNLYATTDSSDEIIFMEQMSSLNPLETTGGFIVPTDRIHVGADGDMAWNAPIQIGFVFEVHTEKLSLSRLQELLVSLTAN